MDGLNEYARFAEYAWRTLTPTRYAQLEDPGSSFSSLGEQAMIRAVDYMEAFSGDDIPGETYHQKVGRLENAKLRAQEVVRQELLTPPRRSGRTRMTKTCLTCRQSGSSCSTPTEPASRPGECDWRPRCASSLLAQSWHCAT